MRFQSSQSNNIIVDTPNIRLFGRRGEITIKSQKATFLEKQNKYLLEGKVRAERQGDFLLMSEKMELLLTKKEAILPESFELVQSGIWLKASGGRYQTRGGHLVCHGKSEARFSTPDTKVLANSQRSLTLDPQKKLILLVGKSELKNESFHLKADQININYREEGQVRQLEKLSAKFDVHCQNTENEMYVRCQQMNYDRKSQRMTFTGDATKRVNAFQASNWIKTKRLDYHLDTGHLLSRDPSELMIDKDTSAKTNQSKATLINGRTHISCQKGFRLYSDIQVVRFWSRVLLTQEKVMLNCDELNIYYHTERDAYQIRKMLGKGQVVFDDKERKLKGKSEKFMYDGVANALVFESSKADAEFVRESESLKGASKLWYHLGTGMVDVDARPSKARIDLKL